MKIPFSPKLMTRILSSDRPLPPPDQLHDRDAHDLSAQNADTPLVYNNVCYSLILRQPHPTPVTNVLNAH